MNPMLFYVAVTIALVALMMLGMGIGVLFSDKELKGSCGGVGGSCACEEAGKPGACKAEDAVEPAKVRVKHAPNAIIGVDFLSSSAPAASRD